ncbi:glycoside hydrolase family 2 TIM barrel-domain containing protein [Leifsonia sp. YIM 134122]|uniref:Glycoside hydrolase family 2 TIM barrel-domain containing protein n=1 Tax=Leifsonia stereocauli TaxID=3134136 RepID=A0ABU9W5N5_9MICO
MINADHSLLPPASEQDGVYPRPQLVRRSWSDLCGEWDFAFDDDNVGLAERWFLAASFERTITVPFPPESAASGINDTSFHRVVWYRSTVTEADFIEAGHTAGRRMLLHFGAVDYRARVWVDGAQVGSHEGGHTPFSFDITDALRPDAGTAGVEHTIVVRVEDDPVDVAQPRGKQDWREQPHVIWYHRTTGIWQPVWLESVPPVSITWVHWSSDPVTAQVHARIGLSVAPAADTDIGVELSFEGALIGRASTRAAGAELEIVVPLPAQTNGQSYEELLWSPEHPRLIDATITLASEESTDAVASYLGLRTATVARGSFLLNERPYYVRSVLNQGYWPDSNLAAPSADALRAEAQIIKDLGFNATRMHQKFEDPRFLFWADRLGLLVWGESPASFTYTPTSASRLVREWLEVMQRDYSHPSIVTWVPLNESWGVQHIAHDSRMRHYARALVELTKAFDPTRPVVSNDGWEQVDTDILAIHDYEGSAEVMRTRYRDRAAIEAMVDGIGPAGRVLVLSGDVSAAPVMLTEFGGISFDVERVDDAWGYTAATSPDDFRQRLGSLLGAIHESEVLAGFCYTQLADTLQETNGLLSTDRVPKLPVEEIRAIITGPGA